MPAATRKKQKTKAPVTTAKRRPSNIRPTVTHPNVPTIDQNNPEALFDVLTIKTVKKRYNSDCVNTITNDEDLERYVRDFPIDDSISQCFENNAAILDNSCMKKENTTVNRTESQEKLVSDTDSENTSGSSRKNFIESLFGKRPKVRDRNDTSPKVPGSFPVKTNAFENRISKFEKSHIQHSTKTSPKGAQGVKQNRGSCEQEIEIGPDFKTDDGNTLLHLAVLGSSCDATSRLVQQYPVLCDSKNKAGLTPIETAIQLGHTDCLSIILEKHVSLSRTKDRAFWNALLIHTVKNDQHECLIVLLKKLEKLGILKPGANDTRDNALVHVAAQNGSVRCLQVLVENGYDVFSRNKNGKTPLNVALESSSFGPGNYLLALDMSKQLIDLYLRNRIMRGKIDVKDLSSSLQQLHSQLKYMHSTSEKFFEELDTKRENILKSLNTAECSVKEDSIGSDMHRRFVADLQTSKSQLNDLLEFSALRRQQNIISTIFRELEKIHTSLSSANVEETQDESINFKEFYRLFVQKRRENAEETQSSDEILLDCIDKVCNSKDSKMKQLSKFASNSQPGNRTVDSVFEKGQTSGNITSNRFPNGILSGSNNTQAFEKTPSGARQVESNHNRSSKFHSDSNKDSGDSLPSCEIPDLIYHNSPPGRVQAGSENSIKRKNSLNSMQKKSFDKRRTPTSRNRISSEHDNSNKASTNVIVGNLTSGDMIRVPSSYIPSCEQNRKQESEALRPCASDQNGRHIEHIQSVKHLVETKKQRPKISVTPSSEWSDEDVINELQTRNNNVKMKVPYRSNSRLDTVSEYATSEVASSNTEPNTVRDTNVSARDAFMKMFPERKAVNKSPIRLSKNCLARISPRCPPSNEIRTEKAWYDASEDEESLYATYQSDSDKTLDDSILFGPVDSV